MNSQPHTGLQTSPFELLYNYVPQRPVDNVLATPTEPQDSSAATRDEARALLSGYLHNAKRKYDAKHRPSSFNVGDEVWYHKGPRETKLGPLYEGPYTIIRADRETFTISRNRSGTPETRLATGQQLKHVREQPHFSEEQTHARSFADESTDTEEASEVEEIPSTTRVRQTRRRVPPTWLRDSETE